jgi:hypothetical protein
VVFVFCSLGRRAPLKYAVGVKSIFAQIKNVL